MRARPRIFTIPQTAPFLDTLARALLAGDLPEPGGAAPAAVDLPRWIILLPTRRACRSLRDAFLRVSDGGALLLPRIRPIGDFDEDETAFAEAAAATVAEGRTALDLPPAIGDLERRLVLARLILRWVELQRTALADDTPLEMEPLAPMHATPAQALALSASLARLMDAVETEQADFGRLADLVPDEFANHWQRTIAFLKIVTEHWPRHLEEHGMMSPAARRNALLTAESEGLRNHPPPFPIIAAGSTGSIPATAALLGTVARLPHGAVVLPGLDLALADDIWQAIDEHHPEHPQYGMKELLRHLQATRTDVRTVSGREPDAAERARLRLVNEAMRPAATTHGWQALDPSTADWAGAARGLSLVEAPTEEDEAEVVALLLRHAVETPERTAALVTPDRTLARRVAARLGKWDLAVDDSGGRPLAKTPAGVFAELICEAAARSFAPVPLLALLKHPLTRLSKSPTAMRAAARALEIAAFRQPILAAGLEGAMKALDEARASDWRRGVVKRLREHDWSAARELLEGLAQAFAPILALQDGKFPLAATMRAHIAAMEALSRDETGACLAWRGEAGEALALLYRDALRTGEAGPGLSRRDWADVHRTLIAGEVIHPRAEAHPRLFIWGPLEARLQHADTLVLGGLNDGTWPRHEETDPWLSRPMRRALGLTPLERRPGLAAHDVAQLLGAPHVVMTRAAKVEGVPTVPSRWVLRLKAVLQAAGLPDALTPAEPWTQWARRRDRIDAPIRIKAPAPRPPVAARPRQLSVTRVETWIANPYAIYARYVLGLEKLDDLAGEVTPALRGTLAHEILNRFTKEHPDRLPKEIEAEILRIANALFDDYGAHPRIRAFWQPQFVRFARWFAETEPGRRAGAARVHAEVKGKLGLASLDFTLTARADRIDAGRDGTLTIYDYKTGAAPSEKQVTTLLAPQLPLEAAIAQAGGFEGINAGPVAGLRYIRVLGRAIAGEDRPATEGCPAALTEEALTKLTALVSRFDSADTPYPSMRRPLFKDAYRFDDYEHLARVMEWQAADIGEEQ